MRELDITSAQEAAAALDRKVKSLGIEVGFAELESAISALEKEGFPPEALMPQTAEMPLGFSFSPQKFWPAYKKILREKLCSEEGELGKLIKSGGSASVGAILTSIVTSLAIPPAALGLMVPIAVIIVNTGIDAFCSCSDETEDPSAKN